MQANGFDLWKEGLAQDRAGKLDESASIFEEAAQSFFQMATLYQEVERAYFEYSTLMEAYSKVERARTSASSGNYEGALVLFGNSCDIFRSTVHFGFLAPYISACATIESSRREDSFEDKFQGYRNAIALLEQSKIALSFKDERHSLMRVIDCYLKQAISEALQVESIELRRLGRIEESIEKRNRSEVVLKESKALAAELQIRKSAIKYLPLDDCQRATEGAFLISYPSEGDMLVCNVGSKGAEIKSVSTLKVNSFLHPCKSLRIPLSKLPKGKTRLVYLDSARVFDEGCMTLL